MLVFPEGTDSSNGNDGGNNGNNNGEGNGGNNGENNGGNNGENNGGYYPNHGQNPGYNPNYGSHLPQSWYPGAVNYWSPYPNYVPFLNPIIGYPIAINNNGESTNGGSHSGGNKNPNQHGANNQKPGFTNQWQSNNNVENYPGVHHNNWININSPSPLNSYGNIGDLSVSNPTHVQNNHLPYLKSQKYGGSKPNSPQNADSPYHPVQVQSVPVLVGQWKVLPYMLY